MPTSCYSCGQNLELQSTVGRRTTCPECDADLHSCVNCRHYDESAPHSCREPQTEHVLEKDSSNACDLFQFGDGASRRRKNAGDDARRQLAALFGDAPPKRDNPKDVLEALFKKP